MLDNKSMIKNTFSLCNISRYGGGCGGHFQMDLEISIILKKINWEEFRYKLKLLLELILGFSNFEIQINVKIFYFELKNLLKNFLEFWGPLLWSYLQKV